MSHVLVPAFDPNTDLILHHADNPTKIVVFVDYQSTLLRRVSAILGTGATSPEDVGAAVAVRFVYSNEAGELGARAAIAAHAQGKLSEMHQALLAQGGNLDRESISKIARSLDLDLDAFQTGLYSAETQATLDRHMASAEQTSFAQYPGVFIDGEGYDGAWDMSALREAITKPIGYRLDRKSEQFFEWAASAGIALCIATVIALVVANVGLYDWYDTFVHTYIGFTFGEWSLKLSLLHWVNDGLMALFFLLVGIEIKREIVNGELQTLDRALLPVVAALGGVIVPALIYVGFTFGTSSANGWGVPMATDIAFTLGLLALVGRNVPLSLKVFVSALAIADDLCAIIVIALFYGEGINFGPLGWGGLMIALMVVLNMAKIYSRTPYLVLGALLWYFLLEGGVHATLAGVVTAVILPSRPAANVEGVALHAGQVMQSEMQNEEISAHGMERLSRALESLREPGFHLQHALERWTNFLILPLFAFVNCGIPVAQGFDLGSNAVQGVMAGLVIGKPLGICLFVWLALKTGKVHLPVGVTWQHIIGVSALCGIGFTMSLFIASAAFVGPALGEAKLAILIASMMAATIGAIILNLPRRG